jgi:hypothetical protein
MRVRLDGAEGLEKEDACVLVRWEASIDEGPWKDLGIVQEIDLDGGTVLAPGWVRDISGTAFQKAQLDVQHRATVRIVPRRFEAGESRIVGTPKNGEDRWAVPGGTTVTWTDRRTEYLYPDYPAEYPVKVADAATDAAMEASLRPKRVLGISIGGGARRSLQMTLDLPTPGPVPAAFDVDLLLPGDDRVLATTTFARAAGSGPEPEAQYFEGLLFVLPDVPPADESTWLLALTSGGAKQVRLVFRPSRDVALGVPDFDRYWDKGLEVTVPVK